MKTPVHARPLATAVALLLAALVISPVVLLAQATMTVKVLLRTTFSGDDSKETLIATAEIPPGASTGRHTHPGDEYATVIEGALEVRVDGQPPKRVNAGEAYHNAGGVVHESRNIGAGPARVVSTFVIEKGKPIMQPVTAAKSMGE